MPRSSTPCTTRRERTRCGRSAGAVTPRRQDPARPAGCIRMHKPVRKRALRQSHLTTPSVRRSVKVLNATAGWDRCRRPRAVIPRDTLATQNVSSLPTQSSGRSFVQKPSRGHFTSRTHPRRAGWNATIAGRYIDRKPSGGPPESSRHFSINSSEPFLPGNWKSPALGADCLRNNIFRRTPGTRESPANSLTSVGFRREFPVLKCFRRQLTNCSCTGLVCSNDRRQSWQRGPRSPMQRRGRWCRRRRRPVIFRKNSDPWRSLSTVPRDALVLASTDCRGSPKTASSGRFRGLLQNPSRCPG